jgi:RHS repeat-associated protein
VYANVGGRLVEENRGGVVNSYVPDTLGSVVQTLDASGNQTSSTAYWPFGEVQTSSGTNPSPWGFVGTLGYYADTLLRLYIRARSYLTRAARWLTVDSLWPSESAYRYADDDPTQWIDPSGTCTRHSQSSIDKCLAATPNGYNCKPGSGCPSSPKPSVDMALALCVFWNESGLCDSFGGRKNGDNGGGIGQLTPIGIGVLTDSHCNKCITAPSQATGSNWCAGAQAAYTLLQCQGLKSYGPPYSPALQKKILACANCVRNGGSITTCGPHYIGQRP